MSEPSINEPGTWIAAAGTGMKINTDVIKEQREREARDLQEEINKDIDAGRHPFQILQRFNQYTGDSMGSLPILEAYVAGRGQNNHQYFEDVQWDMLELTKPYWDLATDHFQGKFHMSIKVQKFIGVSGHEIRIYLHFNHPDDLDAFQVMHKLHDLPHCVGRHYP